MRSVPYTVTIEVTAPQLVILLLFNRHRSLSVAQLLSETQLPYSLLPLLLLSLSSQQAPILSVKNGSGDKSNTLTLFEVSTSDVVSVIDAVGGEDEDRMEEANEDGKEQKMADAKKMQNKNKKRAMLKKKINCRKILQTFEKKRDEEIQRIEDENKVRKQQEQKDDEEDEEVMKQAEETRKFVLDSAIVRIMKEKKSMNVDPLCLEVASMIGARFSVTKQQVLQRIESLVEREYLERDEHDRKIFKYAA